MNVVHFNVSYILWFVGVVFFCINYTYLGKSSSFSVLCTVGILDPFQRILNSTLLGAEISLFDPVQAIPIPPPPLLYYPLILYRRLFPRR